LKVLSFTYDNSTSNNTYLNFTYGELISAQRGGMNVKVDQYIIIWNQGIPNQGFSLLSGPMTISGGKTYIFQVKARNKYGDGPYSDSLSYLAS
jgi:hypothetical protein